MNWNLIIILLTVSLGFTSMTDYVSTRKPRKLIYPLIWAYYFIGMPLLEKFVDNITAGTAYAVVGFVFTIAFAYWDIMKTDNEKKQPPMIF